MRKHRADPSPSLGMGEVQVSHPRRLIAASLADWRRVMSAIEKQNAKRDRVWPRNYSCWSRLPHVRVGYTIKFDRQRIADWIMARESAVPVPRYRASTRRAVAQKQK
jgi:hypothetical protein